MLLLQVALRVKPGGLLLLGTPCSTHVWVSSGSTGKSLTNARGDVSQPCVRQGNAIATRAAMVIMLAICRNVFRATEQPGSSVMVLMETFKRTLCMPTLLGLYESYVVKLPLACTLDVHCS